MTLPLLLDFESAMGAGADCWQIYSLKYLRTAELLKKLCSQAVVTCFLTASLICSLEGALGAIPAGYAYAEGG